MDFRIDEISYLTHFFLNVKKYVRESKKANISVASIVEPSRLEGGRGWGGVLMFPVPGFIGK